MRHTLRAYDLTQQEAADLLDCRRASIGNQLARRVNRGPVAGALEYLLATWPILTADQRDQVRQRLREMRGA